MGGNIFGGTWPPAAFCLSGTAGIWDLVLFGPKVFVLDVLTG